MFNIKNKKKIGAFVLPLFFLIGKSAYAEDGITPEQTTFVFNTILFLISGAFVMWMAAGFCLLEAGLVRSKNVAMQCTKNIIVYAIAALMYGLVGYNLMYPGDNWIMHHILGHFEVLSYKTHEAEDVGYAAGASDFFFQMAFCATTASIVSGAVAERVKFTAFLLFSIVLTAFLYPIIGSWQWGAGFLKDMGFSDFAGSTLVHSAGGWAALSGVLIIGARHGRYTTDGKSIPMRASNLPLAALGCLILWLGWFFFNGGSQLAIGSLGNASDVARIFVNTNTAAAAGAVGCLILTMIRYGKVDITMIINGALGGLVAITAEPLKPTFIEALIFGLIASVIVTYVVELLDRLKLDDVVGAIPVHLACGIFGTIIVPITNSDTSFTTQLIGVVTIAIFMFTTSFVTWKLVEVILKGLRPTLENEIAGLDHAEMGMEAYLISSKID